MISLHVVTKARHSVTKEIKVATTSRRLATFSSRAVSRASHSVTKSRKAATETLRSATIRNPLARRTLNVATKERAPGTANRDVGSTPARSATERFHSVTFQEGGVTKESAPVTWARAHVTKAASLATFTLRFVARERVPVTNARALEPNRRAAGLHPPTGFRPLPGAPSTVRFRYTSRLSGLLAQLVEQRTFNPRVQGSSP
jgi:hypothetical protein